MKKGDQLVATNQLIRFIRGDVKGEDYYEHLPKEKEPEVGQSQSIYWYALLGSLILMAAVYLVIFWEAKKHQSHLEQLTKELDALQQQSIPLENLEVQKSFLQQQKQVYEGVIHLKLSVPCILKEMTHLVPEGVFFSRILVKNVLAYESNEPEGKDKQEERAVYKQMVFEGTIDHSLETGKNKFSDFVAQLHQLPFFTKVQITYQHERETNREGICDFILTCDTN